MSVRFRLLTEADVRAVLTMDDLIEAMTSALQRFSSGRVTQPVRTVIPIAEDAFAGFMPAFVRGGAAESGVSHQPSAMTSARAQKRSARRSSPSSAATTRAGSTRTSRRSC